MFNPDWQAASTEFEARVRKCFDGYAKKERSAWGQLNASDKIYQASLDCYDRTFDRIAEPFYEGVSLAKIVRFDGTKRFSIGEQFALMDDTIDLGDETDDGRLGRVLDWTNEPIYSFNEMLDAEGRLILTRRTVPNYARFFFHAVRGQLGRFIIVESKDELRALWDRPLSSKEENDWFAKIDNAVKDAGDREGYTMLYKPYSAELKHFYQLDAIVVFKNALFRTDIVIAPYEVTHAFKDEGGQDQPPDTFSIGQLQLRNEDLLLEDLPVTIHLPPTVNS